MNTAELAKTITKTNNVPVTRCHLKIPRDEGLTKASLLLEAGNARAVRDLCDLGVIYEAVIYYAEPYLADLGL